MCLFLDRLTIKQPAFKRHSANLSQCSCFLSNFFQNSDNQVKQAHHCQTANPSGYKHQNHCSGHTFTYIQRDQDKGYRQFAFSSTFSENWSKITQLPTVYAIEANLNLRFGQLTIGIQKLTETTLFINIISIKY